MIVKCNHHRIDAKKNCEENDYIAYRNQNTRTMEYVQTAHISIG